MNSSSATCRKITTTARNSLTVRAPILRPRNGPIVNAVAYAARHISVAVLFVATILGMSCLTSTSQAKDVHKPSTYRDIDYSLSSEEARTVHVLEAMTALWFLAIGCCVGSFLNVVVYRAPLGMDIVVPKSRCPKCQIAINPRDNIPVIGWLRLRGKCRHCQAPISPRYPLVELGVGLLFLAFMYRTLLSGGENLPVRDTDLYHGVIWILWYTKWDLVGVYLFQMALLVALWGGTLMEYDGHRWPRRMVSVVAALGVVAVSLWPRLHPIPLLVPASTRLEPPLGIGLLSGLAGLVVSGGVAYAISLLVYRQRFVPAAVADPSASSENSASSHLPIVDADSRRMQFAVAVGLTGLFLGWQTGLAVAVVIGGLLTTHSFFRKYPVAMTSSLVTLLLFVWRPVFHFIWPRVSVFLTHF